MENSVFMLITVYLAVINTVTFLIYASDKMRAQKGLYRIPESSLIRLAVIGGSVGALLGIHILRHKTRHPKFAVGVPVILAVHIIIAAVILWKFVFV